MALANFLIEQLLPGLKGNTIGSNLAQDYSGATSFALPSNATVGGASISALGVVTSASANALVVGPNGATNPSFNVDASTASAATGLNIKSAAAAGGLAVSVITSGTNENLKIDAAGSGTISLATVSTGNIVLGTRTTSAFGLAVTIPTAGNVTGLTITQNDTTNNPNGVTVVNTGTGNSVNITTTPSGVGRSLNISHGGSGSTDIGFAITGSASRSPANTAHLVLITESVTSGVAGALVIADSNTNGTWPSLNITSVRTIAGQIITQNPASNSGIPNFLLNGTQTITGTVADGYHGGLRLTPTYSAATAQTVTRHNYIDLNTPTLSGVGPAANTDAAVFRFNAAAGTHKAVDAATTKTTPSGVDAWVKINLNGTLAYVPAYLSKTA